SPGQRPRRPQGSKRNSAAGAGDALTRASLRICRAGLAVPHRVGRLPALEGSLCSRGPALPQVRRAACRRDGISQRSWLLKSASELDATGARHVIPIEQLRYVRLGTGNLPAATDFAQRILGLQLIERTDDQATFRSDFRDHTLVYESGDPGQQAIGLELR